MYREVIINLITGTPPRGTIEVLEPCDGKLSRTVLRGEGSRKAPALPGAQKNPTSNGVHIMAIISMFYGIIISMYFFDNQQHKLPHIHVKYQGEEAVFSITDGEMIAGNLKSNKARLVQAWIEIHRDELMANWELAAPNKISLLDTIKNLNLRRQNKETFKFLIDHHFKKKGQGTILTGTVISGKAKIGQNIIILPEKLTGKIRSIQKWKEESNFIEAGDRCGISVSDINPEQISRGSFATDNESEYSQSQIYEIEVKKIIKEDKEKLKALLLNGLALDEEKYEDIILSVGILLMGLFKSKGKIPSIMYLLQV